MIENPKNCYHYDHCLFADTPNCVICAKSKNYMYFFLEYGLSCDDCMLCENQCEQKYDCKTSSMFQRALHKIEKCYNCKFLPISRTREPCNSCIDHSNYQADKIPFILCRKSGGVLMDYRECIKCPYNDSIISSPLEANRGYCLCGRYIYPD